MANDIRQKIAGNKIIISTELVNPLQPVRPFKTEGLTWLRRSWSWKGHRLFARINRWFQALYRGCLNRHPNRQVSWQQSVIQSMLFPGGHNLNTTPQLAPKLKPWTNIHIPTMEVAWKKPETIMQVKEYGRARYFSANWSSPAGLSRNYR